MKSIFPVMRKAIIEISDRLVAIFYPDYEYVILIFYQILEKPRSFSFTFDELEKYIHKARKIRASSSISKI